MEFLSTYGKEIVSIFVPFVTWFLNVGIKAKAKLIWGSPHSFNFLVQEPIRNADGDIIQPTQMVRTASIRVINTGRETANKIELVFNWRPQYINLWPVRHYEIHTDPDGRHILIFENLSPKEEIGIEIMSINASLPDLLVVRSAECIAQNVQLVWVRYTSPWLRRAFIFFMMLGFSAAVYWFVTLIQFLVLKTPYLQ